MKDPNIERPKVTRVKITVKSPAPNPPIPFTIIELTTDRNIESSEFPHWPILVFGSFQYSIDQNHQREFPGSPNNIVTYTIDGKAFEDPKTDEVNVDVARDGKWDNANFVYDDQPLC